jgi:fucose 4-O-acetylase-like acetyltransferase
VVAKAAVAARVQRIDALKGFAIVCVVFYHAAGQYFAYTPAAGVVYFPWAVWLRALLFSFMLPLFAFLSGYVMGRPGGFRPRQYFWKRSLGLLVPYLAWETIYGPGKDKHPEMLRSVAGFFGYYAHLFVDPHYEGRMWYLYLLWIALMILGVARLKGDRTWVLLVSVPLVFALGSFGQFHWLRWVYAFVVFGVLWRRYEDRIMPRIGMLGVAGAVLFAPLWWLCEPEQVAYARLSAWAGPGTGQRVVSLVFPLLPMLVGVCAVVALVALSYHLPRVLEHGLAYLGVLSLGIYVTHFHFVEMWRAMPAWFLPINVALATAIAVGLTLLLGKWRVTATLFLGEPWVAKPRALGDVETETL